MNKRHDVIVIGAGIVGVSTAIHLQQKGHAVLLLDKKGIAKETSYGNSGLLDGGYILTFAPPALSKTPKILLGKEPAARINLPSGLKYLPWIADYYRQSSQSKRHENGLKLRPLVENAVEEHKALLNGTDGLKYLSPQGRAKLHRSEESFKNGLEEIAQLEECGVKCDVLDPDAFREIEPDIKPNYHKAVISEGSGRYVNTCKAIESMAQKLAGQGGEIQIEHASDIARTNDTWVVNKQYEAQHVVICVGPWANNLLKPLGHKFPIAMKRGYHKHFKSSAKISHAVVDADVGYLICPMEQGMRITTGVEFASLNAPANPVQIEQVLPKAKELVELQDPIEERAWLGARPCLADSLPVIGQSHKHKGLWFNFGQGHVGLTTGPASGKLLAQMLCGEETFCNPQPYSPDRF